MAADVDALDVGSQAAAEVGSPDIPVERNRYAASALTV